MENEEKKEVALEPVKLVDYPYLQTACVLGDIENTLKQITETFHLYAEQKAEHEHPWRSIIEQAWKVFHAVDELKSKVQKYE